MTILTQAQDIEGIFPHFPSEDTGASQSGYVTNPLRARSGITASDFLCQWASRCGLQVPEVSEAEGLS